MPTLNLPHLTNRIFYAIFGRIFSFVFLTILNLASQTSDKRKISSVWLIGENRGECLKENGYWFYKYCKANHPEIEVYFVIKTISPYYKKDFFNDHGVLKYGSLKHIFFFYRSNLCFYTHTYRDLIYRRCFELFGRKKNLIYLHHGVLGLKKFDSFNKKNLNIMKLFTLGNFLERDILVQQENIDENIIKVTGYARYDNPSLHENQPERQIVYIPTHRNYIKNNLQDKRTFFKTIQNLLNNTQLIRELTQHDTVLKIYLHKEIQYFSDQLLTPSKHIHIVKFGTETPQKLIANSKLLITDYSSVCWDFFLLEKPVIFYRFDLRKYLIDRDSYIDLSENIMGEVLYNETDLISTITHYIVHDFKLNPQFKIFLNTFFPELDKMNCKRIYDEVTNSLNTI